VVGCGLQLLNSKRQSSENGIGSRLHRFEGISGRYVGVASVYRNSMESVFALICGDICNNIKIIPLEIVVHAPAPSIPAHPVY
jgi:hypothetical protein